MYIHFYGAMLEHGRGRGWVITSYCGVQRTYIVLTLTSNLDLTCVIVGLQVSATPHTLVKTSLLCNKTPSLLIANA
jgi:hypothetical protein